MRRKRVFLRNVHDFEVQMNFSSSFIYFHDLPNDWHLFILWTRKQEERVQQVRKKLEEALMADILSRAADTEEMDIEMDSGDEA